jgi:hypothetical protein
MEIREMPISKIIEDSESQEDVVARFAVESVENGRGLTLHKKSEVI